MIRIVIENLLLFLLPTLIYVGYRVLVRMQGGGVSGVLEGVPFVWLFAAGAITVAAFVIYFASFDGGRPGEAYYPPVQRDGKIIQDSGPHPPLPPSGPSAPSGNSAPAAAPSAPTAPAKSPAPAGN